MRDNGPITTTEVLLPDGALLASQTDTGGRIIFANDTFIALSGFTREELIGAPHNLVRHPHMPKAAFRDLWETVKLGLPWEGLVKNRAKNGNFYWVRANVTPVVEDGELKGYISIRTKPGRDEVARAEAAYAALREGRGGNLRVKPGALARTGLTARCQRIARGIASGMVLNLVVLFAAVGGSLAAGAAGVGTEIRALALLAVAAILSTYAALSIRRLHQALSRIETQFGALARGDLEQPIAIVSVPELEVIADFLRSLRAKLAYAAEVSAQAEREAKRTRVAAMREMADKVEETAGRTAAEIAATASAMADSASDMAVAANASREHADEAAHAASDALSSTVTVSAAAEELAASIREIAYRLSHASGITREAVKEGKTAEQTIAELRTEVARIGQVASLIADIASQTNLLALNATIEAARAGEAGRGFAVVASEVKKLASQTSKATEDISSQIAQIQRATTHTVDAVSSIGKKVGEIDEVSVAIAAAMEEQSAATQEISRSINHAASAAESVTQMMVGVVEIAAQTNDKADRLRTEASSLAEGADRSRRTLVTAVRTSVAEAERRMHVRVSANEACVLVLGGVRYDGRLTNISEGGARVAVDATGLPGTKCELQIAAFRLTIASVVADRDPQERALGLAFASLIELPPSLANAIPRVA